MLIQIAALAFGVLGGQLVGSIVIDLLAGKRK